MNTNKRHHLHITVLILLGAFLAARLCFWVLPELLGTWDAKAIDRLFLFRSSTPRFRPTYDDTIVHVDITDSTLKRLKTFYLNRSHYARVIKNLGEMKVSAQMYDFIFAAPSDPTQDEALIDATKTAANVYFGMAFRLRHEANDQEITGGSEAIPYLEKTAWNVGVDGNPDLLYRGTDPLITFPKLASASRGLGFLNLNTDPDGVNRRILLLVRYKGAFYPSFSFRGICDYLRVTPERITVKPGISITLKGAKRPEASSGHDMAIPIDRHGNMLVNFIGPWGRMKHYDFADIYTASEDRDEMAMWADELSGKIILVSEVTTGAADLGPVPTDSLFLSGGIHTSALHTLLQDSFITDLSAAQELIIEGLMLMILFTFSQTLSSLTFTLATLGMGIGYIGIAGAGFLYANLIFPIIRPLMMLAFAVTATVVFRFIKEERTRHFIHTTFGRYLSKEVVEELLNSPHGLEMSGENREVTFLVSDLRGFTSTSSRLPPQDVIQILNDYFERMVDIIARFRGTVDELQGDGMLVFFGAPLQAIDDPERAVACAIEMQRAMPHMNRILRERNLPELAMGIGINTGEVVVGNIGSEKRTKYGAVGTPINTTYRIESHTVGGQILISPATLEKISVQLSIRDTLEAQFKGIDRPMMLYDVTGIQGKYSISVPETTPAPLIHLKTPLEVSCFPLVGKTVSQDPIHGHVVTLSIAEAEILLALDVQTHTNFELRFSSDSTQQLPGVYAKAVSIENLREGSHQKNLRVKFTSVPEAVKTFIKGRLEEN